MFVVCLSLPPRKNKQQRKKKIFFFFSLLLFVHAKKNKPNDKIEMIEFIVSMEY
jgi:hypothetical protein